MEQDKKCVERRARKKDSIVLNILPASVVGDQAAFQLEQAVPGLSRKGVSPSCLQVLATCSTFDQSTTDAAPHAQVGAVTIRI